MGYEENSRSRQPPREKVIDDIEPQTVGGKQRVRDALESQVADDTNSVSEELTTSATASVTDVALIVSAPGAQGLESVASGSTVTIWVGAFDDSGAVPVPVSNETMEVTVTRPDDTTETLTATTDADGNAAISYDTTVSGRGSGQYELEVVDADQPSSVTIVKEMSVGTTVIQTTVSPNDTVFPGEATAFAFHVHDGPSAVGGYSLTLRILDSGGSELKSVTKSTDGNGFASISFTPPSSGSYTVEASGGNGRTASENFTAVQQVVRSSPYLLSTQKGASDRYGGYVETPSGTLNNTDIVVGLYADFAKTDLVTEVTGTTNDTGFFVVDYYIPVDIAASFLYIKVESADGTPITVPGDLVFLEDPSSSSGSGATVSLSGSPNDSDYAPGETVTITVTAEDGGTAIANQQVDVFLRYNYGPPIYSTTVTTDNNGEASTSTTLPTAAPDGVELRGAVAMNYDNTVYRDSISSEVKTYNIGFSPSQITPGASETISIDVAETDTGNAVSGIEEFVDLGYGVDRAGSFSTAGLNSGSDGTDSASVSVPADVGFAARANRINRYQNGRRTRYLRPNLNGTLSTTDTIVAGQDVTFDFSISDSTTVHGIILFGRTGDPRRTFGPTFQGPGSVTIPVPEEYSKGDSLQVSVWAIGDNGTRYYDQDGFTVDDSVSEAFLAERWRTNIGGRVQFARLTTDGSQVFAGNLSADLSALSPGDGSVEWQVRRSGALSDASAVVQNETVYAGSGGGVVYALDATDGSEQWTYSTDSAVVATAQVEDGVLYGGTNDGDVVAVATDGTKQWETSLDGPIYAQAAVANGRVHLTTADGNLVTLDVSDGTELWRLETTADIGHTAPVFYNGTVYLGADKMYALDAADGSQNWTATFGGPSGSTPTLSESTLYVGSSDGSVYAINTDGSTAWTAATGGTVATNPVVVGGRVLVGSTDGSFYVLDASDGSVVGSTRLGAPTRSSALVLNEDAYVGTRSGEVISLANVLDSP